MMLEGVEAAIAICEQERLDILGEEDGAEIIKDMPHFCLLDEVKRLRKVEDAAKVFFSWYNKTYPATVSTQEDHPWCKLGIVLDEIRDNL